jgi:predicted alpha-1,2-mannosidase
VEGSAWQYLFFVPQDMEGLKLLLGGDDAFVKRLQECFDKGHYDATNEPDISWAYLFDYVPQEGWRAQKQVRGLMDRNYGTGPDGLPGNDDAGTLSAWYVFSALGFYPVCPGSNTYQVGSPIFKQVTAHLNKTFFPGGLLAIKTIDNSERNVYVQSILVDGVPYQKLDLTQESFVMGKTLVFTMGSQPKK